MIHWHHSTAEAGHRTEELVPDIHANSIAGITFYPLQRAEHKITRRVHHLLCGGAGRQLCLQRSSVRLLGGKRLAKPLAALGPAGRIRGRALRQRGHLSMQPSSQLPLRWRRAFSQSVWSEAQSDLITDHCEGVMRSQVSPWEGFLALGVDMTALACSASVDIQGGTPSILRDISIREC